MNRKRSIAVSIVLIAVLLIGGLLAFYADAENITNTFTIGNVNITLTEPNWDSTDENSNNIPDAAEEKRPGQTIAKDPTITLNTGSNDAYLFIKVENPAITTGEGETVTKELFTYTINPAWAEVTAKQNVKANSVEHVYVYGTEASPTLVSAETSIPAIFQEITVNETLTNAEVTNSFTGNQNIVVQGYGIQAEGLTVAGSANIFDLF